MSNKNLTLGLVIAILIAVGGYFFPQIKQSFGAVPSGPTVGTTNFDSISVVNGISNGGVFSVSVRNAALTQATTTVCAIQGPNATTSVAATLLLTVGTSTASTVTIATAATPYATTTTIGSTNLAAGAQGVATTSAAALLGPLQYVVFGMQGGTGTFSPTGVCTAAFKSLQ